MHEQCKFYCQCNTTVLSVLRAFFYKNCSNYRFCVKNMPQIDDKTSNARQRKNTHHRRSRSSSRSNLDYDESAIQSPNYKEIEHRKRNRSRNRNRDNDGHEQSKHRNHKRDSHRRSASKASSRSKRSGSTKTRKSAESSANGSQPTTSRSHRNLNNNSKNSLNQVTTKQKSKRNRGLLSLLNCSCGFIEEEGDYRFFMDCGPSTETRFENYKIQSDRTESTKISSTSRTHSQNSKLNETTRSESNLKNVSDSDVHSYQNSNINHTNNQTEFTQNNTNNLNINTNTNINRPPPKMPQRPAFSKSKSMQPIHKNVKITDDKTDMRRNNLDNDYRDNFPKFGAANENAKKTQINNEFTTRPKKSKTFVNLNLNRNISNSLGTQVNAIGLMGKSNSISAIYDEFQASNNKNNSCTSKIQKHVKINPKITDLLSDVKFQIPLEDSNHKNSNLFDINNFDSQSTPFIYDYDQKIISITISRQSDLSLGFSVLSDFVLDGLQVTDATTEVVDLLKNGDIIRFINQVPVKRLGLQESFRLLQNKEIETYGMVLIDFDSDICQFLIISN